MEPLLGLFAASFAAATLFPLPSEAALFAYLQLHPENAALGWLRIHWAAALGFMAAGRCARYLVVAYFS